MRLHHSKSLFAAALVPLVLALAGPATPSASAPSKLTNGCGVSARGIPSCGAYMGGAYGGNANLAPWEKYNGRTHGVHRTYWGPQHRLRSQDGEGRRRKEPRPLDELQGSLLLGPMANGKGDAWARKLATQMRTVKGPVWVAVHHEPEGDGNIQTWKKMQARLAPIMRAKAPNLGYSIILMGYHQLYGNAKYRLGKIWPKTKIDVAGFDIYEKYGTHGRNEWKQFTRDYFRHINRWAKRTGVAWGLAETAFNDKAARADHNWASRAFRNMDRSGGIAFSYFNTNLHSQQNWKLSNSIKKNSFKRANATAARMR